MHLSTPEIGRRRLNIVLTREESLSPRSRTGSASPTRSRTDAADDDQELDQMNFADVILLHRKWKGEEARAKALSEEASRLRRCLNDGEETSRRSTANAAAAAKMKSRCSELQDSLKSSYALLDASQLETAKLSRRLKAKSRKLAEVEREAAQVPQLKIAVEKLIEDKEKEKVEDAVGEGVKRADEEERRCKAWRTQVDELSLQVVRSAQQCRDLSSERARLESELARVNILLEQSRERVSRAESDLRDLRDTALEARLLREELDAVRRDCARLVQLISSTTEYSQFRCLWDDSGGLTRVHHRERSFTEHATTADAVQDRHRNGTDNNTIHDYRCSRTCGFTGIRGNELSPKSVTFAGKVSAEQQGPPQRLPQPLPPPPLQTQRAPAASPASFDGYDVACRRGARKRPRRGGGVPSPVAVTAGVPPWAMKRPIASQQVDADVTVKKWVSDSRRRGKAGTEAAASIRDGQESDSSSIDGDDDKFGRGRNGDKDYVNRTVDENDAILRRGRKEERATESLSAIELLPSALHCCPAWREAMRSEWSCPSDKMLRLSSASPPFVKTVARREEGPAMAAADVAQPRQVPVAISADTSRTSAISPAWGGGVGYGGSCGGASKEEDVRWGRVDLLSVLYPAPTDDPLPRDAGMEASVWVPREAAGLCRRFVFEYDSYSGVPLDHVQRNMVLDLLTRLNDTWRQSERRHVGRLRARYRAELAAVSRKLEMRKPMDVVIAKQGAAWGRRRSSSSAPSARHAPAKGWAHFVAEWDDNGRRIRRHSSNPNLTATKNNIIDSAAGGKGVTFFREVSGGYSRSDHEQTRRPRVAFCVDAGVDLAGEDNKFYDRATRNSKRADPIRRHRASATSADVVGNGDWGDMENAQEDGRKKADAQEFGRKRSGGHDIGNGGCQSRKSRDTAAPAVRVSSRSSIFGTKTERVLSGPSPSSQKKHQGSTTRKTSLSVEARAVELDSSEDDAVEYYRDPERSPRPRRSLRARKESTDKNDDRFPPLFFPASNSLNGEGEEDVPKRNHFANTLTEDDASSESSTLSPYVPESTDKLVSSCRQEEASGPRLHGHHHHPHHTNTRSSGSGISYFPSPQVKVPRTTKTAWGVDDDQNLSTKRLTRTDSNGGADTAEGATSSNRGGSEAGTKGKISGSAQYSMPCRDDESEAPHTAADGSCGGRYSTVAGNVRARKRTEIQADSYGDPKCRRRDYSQEGSSLREHHNRKRGTCNHNESAIHSLTPSSAERSQRCCDTSYDRTAADTDNFARTGPTSWRQCLESRHNFFSSRSRIPRAMSHDRAGSEGGGQDEARRQRGTGTEGGSAVFEGPGWAFDIDC